MDQLDKLQTIGKDFYPGLEVNLYCSQHRDDLVYPCLKDRYRIVYIKDGYGVFKNGIHSQIITSPMILCLNEQDNVVIEDAVNLKLDIMYFDPICFERYKPCIHFY